MGGCSFCDINHTVDGSFFATVAVSHAAQQKIEGICPVVPSERLQMQSSAEFQGVMVGPKASPAGAFRVVAVPTINTLGATAPPAVSWEAL